MLYIVNRIIIIASSLFLLTIILSGCNLLYFIPPKESVLEFTIGSYKGKWVSQGFEAVGDEKCIAFYSKETVKGFNGDSMHIWLKKPVEKGTYTEKNSRVEFYNSQSDERSDSLFNHEDQRTKIIVNLKTWSTKPRGLIEGDIEADFYDYYGKKHIMKGHFTAYQALGTINSYH